MEEEREGRGEEREEAILSEKEYVCVYVYVVCLRVCLWERDRECICM